MILVTGGTGFIGRHLVDALSSHGRSVRVLTRSPPDGDFPENAGHVQGDLADRGALARALEGIRVVVHLAACLRSAAGDAAELERVNVRASGRLARAAVEHGVTRFVHMSSAGVYGMGQRGGLNRENGPTRPVSPYQRSKLAAEVAVRDALEASSVRWVILRPAAVYGSGSPTSVRVVTDVLRHRVWFYGPHPVTVHPTHVRDVVQAVRCALEHGDVTGETFNVGGERPMDHRDLVRIVCSFAGRAPRILSLPRATLPLTAVAGVMLRALGFRTPPSLTSGGANFGLDLSKVRAMLGWTPVPFEVELAKALDWAVHEGLA